MRVGAAAAALWVVTAATREARADGDGSHGRFAGDLAVVAGAGIAMGPRAPRLALDARVRYLSTAGLFATYEDGASFGFAAEPRRVFVTGLELRPLFLGRWAKGVELDQPLLDLLIDSFAIELGAAFSQPTGGSWSAGGPGLALGAGLELPLLARPSGPIFGLHGGARFGPAALSGGPLVGPVDRALYLTLVVGYQQLFGGRVVGSGDVRARR